MTTLAPTLDLVGDIGSFSLFKYDGEAWVAYLRQSGELELHKVGSGLVAFTSIDVPYPKAQISVAVLGTELLIFWTHTASQAIYFSKWDLDFHYYTQAPTLLWSGSSPAAAIYSSTKLMVSYVDPSGQHVVRTSFNGGATWDSPVVVDNEETVYEVDVDIYPSSSQNVSWAESSNESL